MRSNMPRIVDRSRPLAALFGIAAAIVALWCAVAIFLSSRFITVPGQHTPWRDVFSSELVSALIWAVFTPIVVALAERIPLRRERIVRDVLALIVIIAILATTRTVANRTIPLLQYNMFVVAVIVGITKLMDVYRDADASERQALALEGAVANAEAEHLRAQTQPSLLFGTLSSIRERVTSDPAAADTMLVALGELLRRHLDQPAGTLVTLEEELIATERHLELLRVRHHFAVDDDVLEALVPPFALQTLLGIAIGDARPTSLAIRVERRAESPLVQRLALEAHASPVDATAATLAAAREQLQQRFAGGNIRTSGSTMIAFVALPLQYANDAAYDPARPDRRG
jgi:hypothetical protein